MGAHAHNGERIQTGSGFDRELLELALSVNEAILWVFRFAADDVTWMPGMDALLGVPGAPDDEIRGRLLELLAPYARAARSMPESHEFSFEREVEGTVDDKERVICFRARRFGNARTGGLAGTAVDAARARGNEQALADLTDRYRLLVERSPDAICVHQHGLLTYVNPAAVRMLAAESEAQFLGRPITEFVEPRSAPRMHERIAALTEEGASTAPAEVVLRRFDGGTVLVQAASVRTTWEGETAYQVIMRDVTRQKAAEATLHYQAALVRHVSDAIVATDYKGMVTSWNPAAESVYGVPSYLAVGRYVSELVGAPLDPGELVAEGGVTQAVHRKRNGATLVVRVSAAAMNDGYVLVCADETAQRKAERYFATVVASLDEGVVVIDSNGVIESANPAALRHFGVSSEEMIGSRPDSWPMYDESGELVPAEERPSMRTRLGGEQENSRVMRLIRPDGEHVWLAFTSRALAVDGDAMHSVVTSFIDVTDRFRQIEMLHYQATHDELTGLLNRKGVKELLGELVEGGTEQIGLLFCDIDNFKRVNDSLGHEAGDELLVVLSRRLQSCLPEGCTAARLSGDEFVIVCSEVDALGGLDELTLWAADFLRTSVPVGDQLVSVSASIGAAMLEGTMTGEDLMRYADMAMFHAKRRGPGRVAMASHDLVTAVEGQLRLEEQLREAIANDRLVLHLQPIVDRDGRCRIGEALVRWPHPEHGLLSPAVILPVAEQGDLLRQLDRWVLRAALREAATWPTTAGGQVAVAVNLAALLPDAPGFVAEISTALDESGLECDRLVLEMVETVLVDLPGPSREAMVELTERGVRFAVDDFGTGYSSLARIKELPAQIVKLDRHFVSDVDIDDADQAIARAVVDMARAMDRSCVAEGVESNTQLRVLDELGIDLYQGFLFSRPLPPAEFRALLAG